MYGIIKKDVLKSIKRISHQKQSSITKKGIAMKKLILALLLTAFPVLAAEQAIDNILVEKSARKMYLRQGDKNIKEYNIRLGSNPTGHKEQEGDGRTPEGKYTISGRNPKSAYHLSLRISYPNAADKKRAADKKVNPGGDIMIHGYPNYAPNTAFDVIHNNYNWTAGCIAVTDKEIEEIWQLVLIGTPIEIKP